MQNHYFLTRILISSFLLFIAGASFIFANEKDEAKITPTDNEEVIRLKNELQILKFKKQIAELKNQAKTKELLDKKIKLQLEVQLLQSKNEKLKHEINILETTKKIEQTRKNQVLKKLKYTKSPLDKNKILKISDRRITLDGPIMGGTSKYIAERIHFFNNQHDEYPIFIVINNCPGGSVFEGYQIIQTMLASAAPVHVVVKRLCR